MIKKIGLVVLCTTLATIESFAHDLWIDGNNNNGFKGYLKYEHVFFIPQKIENDRIALFEPIVVIDKNNENIVLKKDITNGEYSLNKSLDNGTYILKSSYKPTYSTKGSNNKWNLRKTKQDIQNAQYCKQISRFAKSIINVGDDKNNFVTKAIGQNFEIVPLDNPSNFKIGVPFKVKVLLEGKAIKDIEIQGTFENYTKNKFVFKGISNEQGEVEIIPTQTGKWILLAETSKQYEKNEICDEKSYSSTLSFQIK
ncbi:DUF4198 domain-containing protein [Aliarcobacter cryaerophilus]|uniref:DUF4198 domain-containing protein n=1 Tax=Aliarcobacter cryaerophilus TaxID=28198 RepID=UPI003DA45C8A